MKKKKGGQVLQVVLSLLAGIALGMVYGQVIVGFLAAKPSQETSIWLELLQFAVLLAGVYLSYFLQLAIHEAGHLVFGLLTGYRFVSYRFLSFMCIRENGRLRLRRLSLAGTAGQCLMAPPEMQDGKLPVLLYNLGGSIMNLFTAALAFLGWYLLGRESIFSVMLLLAAIAGVLIGLMNGIPIHLGMVDNDGRNAVSLTEDVHARQAFWQQMKIAEQLAMGLRLRDMPQQWFVISSQANRRNALVTAIDVFACNRLIDEMHFSEAAARMAALLNSDTALLGLHRQMLICDRIYCELIGENRQEVLTALYTKEQIAFARAMKKNPSVLRTQYAYALLAQKDPQKAAAIQKQFEKVAGAYPYPAEIASEEELMQYARERAALQ